MKYIAIYLLCINILACFLYWLDKYKAVRNQWRIRESVLFLVALLGGSVGALIAMYVFRHKTRHLSFVIGIPVILLLQIVLGFFLYRYYDEHLPYQMSPVKLVEHELSTLQNTSADNLEQFIGYENLFPSDDADMPLSEDWESVFISFFEPFSYEILHKDISGSHASITVSLRTLDGEALAKAYSKEVLIKQIQNTASPANVSFSLADCYLLLNNVLQQQQFPAITTEYTINLTRSLPKRTWSIDDPGALQSAVTGNFALHVADPDLFRPAEIVSIYFDTLKGFDSEQLNRFLALDELITGQGDATQTFTSAIADQIITYLDYTILSETIAEDGHDATVSIELTNLDCHAIMEQYQEQVRAYTATSQALQDGYEVRVQKSYELLVKALSENTASAIIPVSISLHNDGSSWQMELTPELSQALLGNFTSAYQEASTELENQN